MRADTYLTLERQVMARNCHFQKCSFTSNFYV